MRQLPEIERGDKTGLADKAEKKKWPVLQAIKVQAKTSEDGVYDTQVPKQETISQQSNGTVPNVPHVSPEELIKQGPQKAPFSIQVVKLEHSPQQESRMMEG